MLVKIAGMVRGLVARNYPEGREDQQLEINTRGDQLIAQALPELTELVRMGNSWQVRTSTAFAALVAVPTTVAAMSLYNGEPAGGKSYVLDSIAVSEIVVDATQQNQLALFCMNNKVPVTAPTHAAQTLQSLSGRSNYGGLARTTVGGTVVNDGWFPHGTSGPSAGAVAGGAWRNHDFPLRGLYIIPPGGMFSAHVAKIAATASQCHLVFRWHEVLLPVVS